MQCNKTGCVNQIVRTSPRANNKKFCSKECQASHYKEQNAAKIKATHDRHNHARYSQYAPGKEKCIICEAEGKEAWYKAVCHHATQIHNVNEREYKRLLGADVSKGRITESLKLIKRQHVFANGTVNNLKKGVATRYKPGDPRAGKYERSLETIKRLKRQFA